VEVAKICVILKSVANTEQNGHGNPRLDRLELVMELLAAKHRAFSDEHKKLLAAHIALTAKMNKLIRRRSPQPGS
jgi:hypothetical protein